MKKQILLMVAYFSFACLAWDIAFAATPQGYIKINYVLISSEELSGVNDIWRQNIKAVFADAQETYLDYNSFAGQQYIQELQIKFIPFVIYDDAIAAKEQFFPLVQQKLITQSKGHYVISEEQLKRYEIMFLGRQREPNKLSIFAMSHCPYAQEAEATLIDFIRHNNLNEVQINIKYLVEINEFGITSLHGPAEIREDLRQIAIQRFYPDKFLDYLLLLRQQTPEEAAKALRIPLNVIDAKQDTAIMLLKKDFAESQDLGLSRSPSFLWENMYLIPRLEDLKRHRPFSITRTPAINIDEVAATPIPMHFFYSNACSSCLDVKENILPEIKTKYKDRLMIHYHNIGEEQEFKLKLAMEKEYAVLRGAIPEIFLPSVALEGKEEIRKKLSGAIEEILNQKSLRPAEKKEVETNPVLSKFASFNPLIVIFSGLADGINPCAFATIVFFVSLLAMNSYRKKQIACIGGAFILGVFLTYLSLGLGIMQVLKKIELFSFWSRIIYFSVALLALSLGIYHLIDYIKYKTKGEITGCNLKTYQRLRKVAQEPQGLILLVIFALVSGLLIALLESACTGQVYLPIIALVLKTPALRINALFYLTLYNLAFILPLLVIFILAYQGITTENFTLFTQRHYAGMKITYTLLFFGLAIFLFIS